MALSPGGRPVRIIHGNSNYSLNVPGTPVSNRLKGISVWPSTANDSEQSWSISRRSDGYFQFRVLAIYNWDNFSCLNFDYLYVGRQATTWRCNSRDPLQGFYPIYLGGRRPYFLLMAKTGYPYGHPRALCMQTANRWSQRPNMQVIAVHCNKSISAQWWREGETYLSY